MPGRAPASGFRHIYAVSDLHTDYELNLEWVKKAAPEGHADSVLLVAGDVSDRIGVFEATMSTLADAFGAVFFVPGNHDLWVRRDGSEGTDSLQKLERLTAICESLGVFTTPQRVRMARGGVVSICPLLSFHHTSFDTEPDVEHLRLPSARVTVTDFRATRWPHGLEVGDEKLALHLDACNDELPFAAARQAAAHRRTLHGPSWVEPIRSWEEAHAGAASVVSFSHFLPRIELMPEKRFLVYPDLLKARARSRAAKHATKHACGFPQALTRHTSMPLPLVCLCRRWARAPSAGAWTRCAPTCTSSAIPTSDGTRSSTTACAMCRHPSPRPWSASAGRARWR